MTPKNWTVITFFSSSAIDRDESAVMDAIFLSCGAADAAAPGHKKETANLRWRFKGTDRSKGKTKRGNRRLLIKNLMDLVPPPARN